MRTERSLFCTLISCAASRDESPMTLDDWITREKGREEGGEEGLREMHASH